MSQRRLLSLFCLSLLFLSVVQLTRAGGDVSVNESRTIFRLHTDRAEVLFAVENTTGETRNVAVKLELLDTQNSVLSETTGTQAVAPGSQTLRFNLPPIAADLNRYNRRDLLWYRLRYRMVEGVRSSISIHHGTISLSEISPDIFDIRVATSEMAREGGRYRARVQATHPLTRHPAAGVNISGEISFDDSNGVKPKATATTGKDGYAILSFVLPQQFVDSNNGEIHVVGTRDGIIAEAEGEVQIDSQLHTLITSDKVLYQPGQTMHLRALVFNSAKRALANQNILIRIVDPESVTVFVTTIKSSRFGVVNADWAIPDNVRLGDYRVWVDREGENYQTSYDVRISRYELPNFSVNVQRDRDFYLPGQNAKVKVRADYLFGQPVKRGHVRVVGETGREWNFREQKWDFNEGDEYEGETDAQGVFTANVDLENEHDDLSGSGSNQFRDITYAAYFTDPTTNRTEQRRFTLRVTKEPIHVYIIERDPYNDQNRKLPFEFYVSTFYADGTPARCRVNVELSADETVKKTIIRTNRYGLAKTIFRFPELGDSTSLDLKVVATDRKGRSGNATEDVSIDDDERVFVETGKTLYRIGEPIIASITSSLPDQTLIVELANAASVIRSERVQLRGGRATATFPYAPNLTDRITIAAYPDFVKDQEQIGIRTILYPANPELNLKVKTSQASYRPGEDASVRFNVRTPDGQPAETALGVVVSDKAVEERMRSDSEFGSYQPHSYSLDQFLGLDEQLSGVTFRDLRQLDMTKPVSPDLDLLAEVLLNRYRNYYPVFYSGDEYPTNLLHVFGNLIGLQLQPVREALHARYLRTLEYPNDEKTLRRFLREANIDFETLLDPWGVNYRATFSIDKQMDVLTFTSAGADKRFDTDDDIFPSRVGWEYFLPFGQKIRRAVENYHNRTKGFIRDSETLREELARDGDSLDQIRDPWGQPYRVDFVVENTQYVIKIISGGPDRTVSTSPYVTGDDFIVFGAPIDYFTESREQIDKTLRNKLRSTGKFPQNDSELREALRDSEQPFELMRDPWNKPYYAIFTTQSNFGDRVQIENRAALGNSPTQQTKVVPVTRTFSTVTLKSSGADGVEGSADDFSVASFSQMIAEQSRNTAEPATLALPVVLSNTTGAIHGFVTDPQSARVAGATITATRTPDINTYQTKTDDNGEYLLDELLPGTYEVRIEVRGFVITVMTNVTVRVASVTEVNAMLEPGGASEAVTVSAAPISNLMLEGVVAARSLRALRVKVVTKSGSTSAEISTPRLREYFPETLVWQPSIETDGRGRAEIKFKLADNITTWKMDVIGSTENGLVGTAEMEFKAFQPFFVEHDPPRVLTEGDEISLPVVVRNYLNRLQRVDVEIKPEQWFSLMGPVRKQTAVAAGDAVRQTFDFRVVSSVDNGRQRITALGADANDAIEKPVTVHPDGEEKSVTAGDLLTSSAALELDLPANVIANSTRAELKIYPNLMAHVVESVEAIMERPYGCGEQTISSAYPSLLVLRNYKQTGEDSPLRARAQRYLNSGYTRLLNYRDEDGGFAYWDHGNPDIALTAYALRFLTDASGVMELDREVIERARKWLIKEQGSDGSWPPHQFGYNELTQDRQRAVLTAYVARILATTQSSLPAATDNLAAAEHAALAAALKRAMEYVGKRTNEIDEPYLLASYALTLIELRDTAAAKPVIEKLRSLAQTEGIGTYWALETNTPFYGWGLAGRVETTALVVQALSRYCGLPEGNCDASSELIKRGLLFLFQQKDPYGVWYSTQATINVLDTMLTLFATNQTNSDATSTAQIEINGRVVQTVQIPETRRTASLITVPIGPFLSLGKNRIAIKRPGGGTFSSVQALANYYTPWPQNLPVPGSSDLRLLAKFDKTEGRIGDSFTCHVEAQRVGFKGYGMLLAEIGLPPGADVDRNSLETAVKRGNVMQYDVLPDRILLYLWPRAGGVKIDFQFRPRFGLAAKNAPSVIYDYYNPESRVVVAPVKFRVK